MSAVPATGDQHVLAAGGQRAVVTEVGATLRSWTAAGGDVVDGFEPASPGTAFRGKVLMPWPNRLAGARYAFGGAEHVTPVTEPELGNALHGLVTWVNWRLVDRSDAAVTLGYRLHPQPGFPFTLDLRAGYRLSPDGLEVTLQAENLGPGPAPFGTGWHPYFATGGAAVDEVRLELPATGRLDVDDRLVPRGAPVPVDGTAYDFRRRRPVGDVRLDTCFTGIEHGADGFARARLELPDGRDVELWMDERFRFLQAFTADDVPEPDRRRRCLALEPMTCAPDAFNSGDGLVVLEPGEAFEGRCGARVS